MSLKVEDLEPIYVLKVGYCDVPIYEAPMEDFGEYHHRPFPYIALRNSMETWRWRETLLHEINHAGADIFAHTDRKLNEEQWSEVGAMILTTIFRDNPGFYEWFINYERKK